MMFLSVCRLEKKMKDLENEHQETLDKMKGQYRSEVSSLQASLDRAESQHADVMKEVRTLKLFPKREGCLGL